MNFFSFFDYLNREVFTQDASYLPDTFIQKLPLVDDNIKFAKVFNDNINEIAEAHHILLEKTLKEREIVFQRRRKKEKWVYRNNRVQQNDVR